MTNSPGEPSASQVPEWDLLDRLHKALRVAEMSPGDMAEYLNVHRNTVGNYLRASTKIDRRTLMLWALRTGVPLEWLENGNAPGPDNGPEGGESGRRDSNSQHSAWKAETLAN